MIGGKDDEVGSVILKPKTLLSLGLLQIRYLFPHRLAKYTLPGSPGLDILRDATAQLSRQANLTTFVSWPKDLEREFLFNDRDSLSRRSMFPFAHPIVIC